MQDKINELMELALRAVEDGQVTPDPRAPQSLCYQVVKPLATVPGYDLTFTVFDFGTLTVTVQTNQDDKVRTQRVKAAASNLKVTLGAEILEKKIAEMEKHLAELKEARQAMDEKGGQL